jgi:hypothetical protein
MMRTPMLLLASLSATFVPLVQPVDLQTDLAPPDDEDLPHLRCTS